MKESWLHHTALKNEPDNKHRFGATRWTLVIQTSDENEDKRREALESLCEMYWYPLYAFVRRVGHSPHTAEDLTQEFLARFVERGDFGKIDRERGKLRSYMIGALKNFLTNERENHRSLKRGGGELPISIDQQQAEQWYGSEPADDITPEKLYDRRWALIVLQKVIDGIRRDYAARGKERDFDVLEKFLTWNSGESYEQAAELLGKNPNAVKVAVHRLRKRYRDLLREEIAQTVGPEEDVDEELKSLFMALS